jgi:hypothetical protein
VLTALLVFAVHCIVSWGYIGLYWGDSGRWLYEVDRFANGARLYRDVYWGFPPLGMWVVGGAAGVIGSDLTAIWTITGTIAALFIVAYGLVVAQLLPTRFAVPAALAGAALGVTYANNGSPPLVSGMYSPAIPVAMCLAFTQLALFLREWRKPTLLGAIAIGALGAAGVLTKHDVWFLCGLLTLAAFVTPASSLRRAFAGVLAFAAVLGCGLGVLIAQNGAAALPLIFSGHGQVQELGTVFFPNLAQLVMDLGALGVALAAVATIALISGALSARRALPLIIAAGMLTSVAIAVWLTKAEAASRAILASGPATYPTLFEGSLMPVAAEMLPRLKRAFAIYRLELLRHVFPLMLPLLVLALTFVRRRFVEDQNRWRLLVILLLGILALRSRRMLSFSEWSALMLEVPVYAFALTTLWQLPRPVLTKAVALGCALLLFPSFLAQRRFGYGLGSRRGPFPQVETARGNVRLSPNLAATLRDVRDLALLADPSGTRPLLSFGYSSGHNYLVGRPGVGALTHGFRISTYPTPDSAYRVAQAMHDRLILVDSRAYSAPNPVRALTPWRWQPVMQQNHYLRVDRPLFEKLLAGCRPLVLPDRKSVIEAYDCAPGSQRDLTKGASN